jgi:MFS family permease
MFSRPRPLSPVQRRRALGLGLVNGALWSIGNALITGSLVSYLARDLGAQGLALSLVLAAPNLAGVLRLVAPALIDRAGTARWACLTVLLASYLLIVGLPLIALAAPVVSRTVAVAAMISLLFAHQLLEYVGTVALWSWRADLVPLPIRGRYFGRRQMIQLGVSIPTLLASGYFADHLRERFKDQSDRLLLAYAIPIALGAACLLASLLPLVLMPATRRYPRPQAALLWSAVVAPFADRRFWRLLIFRSWFSLSNGISQIVQNVVYPKDVLNFGVGPMAVMKVTTQIGQMSVARWVGRWSDRIGNRPVLLVAQACVAASLLFYILARGPDTRWLLLGAWILFAAYVAHNICLPNLVLLILALPGERGTCTIVHAHSQQSSRARGSAANCWPTPVGTEIHQPSGTYCEGIQIVGEEMEGCLGPGRPGCFEGEASPGTRAAFERGPETTVACGVGARSACGRLSHRLVDLQTRRRSDPTQVRRGLSSGSCVENPTRIQLDLSKTRAASQRA